MKYLLLLGICGLILSCELFPPGDQGLQGPAGLTGTAGGTAGQNGTDGATIPGGILAVYSNSSALQATSVIRIIFDDDTIINENDVGEIEIVIALGPYVNGSDMNHSLIWSAPGVPPGDYFVYSWIDTSDTDVFNTDPNFHDFFDETGDFFASAGNINSSLNAVNLVPNYTVTLNFAAQLYFSFSHSV